MRTAKDVEAYLGQLNRTYETVEGGEGTFLVRSSSSMPPIALRVDPPLVVFRVHIGAVPERDQTALYRKLLSLNAKALVHASFGLEDNRIVLSSALEIENLDFNEVEAVLDEIDLALVQHVPELLSLSKKNA